MATMGHTEKEQIREDIELLQMTLQGTEDEFSPDEEESEDETQTGLSLIMDVEEGSIPEISIGQRSTFTGTETPITIFSEDDVESQYSQERSVSMASTSQEDVQYSGPPINEENLGDDPETCLALNRAYQELVQNNLQKIEAVLAENRARQVAIHEDMDTATRNAKEQKTEKKKLVNLNVYQMPYLKDASGAGPPPNIDVQMKRASTIDEPILPAKRLKAFNKNDRKKFIEAVQADNLQRWLRPLMSRLELQEERLVRATDPEEEATLKQLIQDTEREIERVNSLPPMQLAGTIEDADKVDWMKIAAADFDGRTTSHLHLSWKNSIHPAINWNDWTKTEDKRLAEVVEAKNAVNWDEIAKDLDTGRTAFQCIQRYQQRLNPNHCNREQWTPEDNEKLLELVKNIEKLEGLVTNWSKIAVAFDGRTERQCLTQYQKINPDQRNGRWLEEEDSKLLAGIRTFGPMKWFEIAKLVPGRNGSQCRERWYNSLSINLKLGEWTYEEDRAIILNHQKYNGRWSKIAQCLPGRTDNQVMTRFQKMEKWADLARKEDKLYQATGIKTKVPAGDKGERKPIQMPQPMKEAADYSLVQMARRIADEQTEAPNVLDLIRQDRANNLFVPRPPDAAVRFKVLHRILERRRKVYDTLCNLFYDKKKVQHDDKEIDSGTLKSYIEKRKDVLSPALIKKLKEVVAQGKPLKIREVLALSKKLKASRRWSSKSYVNQKAEKEMIKIIHMQIPSIVRRGRPKKIWVEGASVLPEEEEETRNKVSMLLLKAFCLDPAQLLRRAAFNRPGAVNGELLELLKRCRPPSPPGAAEVVEVDSEETNGPTGLKTTEEVELERRDADASLSVAADESENGSSGSNQLSREVGDKGVESQASTTMDGVSEEAEVERQGAEAHVGAKGKSKSVACRTRSNLPSSNSGSREPADGGESVEEDAGPSKDNEKGSSRQTRSKSPAKSNSGSKEPADEESVAADAGPSKDNEKRSSSRTRSKSRAKSNSRSSSNSATKEPEGEKSNIENTGSKDHAKRGSQQTRSKSRSRSNSGATLAVEVIGEASTECLVSEQTPNVDAATTKKLPRGKSDKDKGQSNGNRKSRSNAVPIVGKYGDIIGYTIKGSRNSSPTRSRSNSESVTQTKTVPATEAEREQRYPGFVTKEVVSGSDKDTRSVASSQKYAEFVPNPSFVANNDVPPLYSKVISKELNIPRPVLIDKSLEKKSPELLRRIRSPPVKQPYLFVKNDPPLKGEPDLYNIPPLPPTATSLFAFRSLLLNRRKLLQTTTKFTRSERAKARYRQEKIAKSQGQRSIEGGQNLGECAVGEGMGPSGDGLVVGHKQGVENQQDLIGGPIAIQKEVGPAGDAPQINSVSEVIQEKSPLKEAEPMQISSTEDVIMVDLAPTQSKFATQEDFALDNSLQTKITSSGGTGLDEFDDKACPVVSVSAAEQDLVDTREKNQTEKGSDGSDESDESHANHDITDVDIPAIGKDLGNSACSVSPGVVVSDAGRQSVDIGDNVENSAGRQSVDVGDNVENSTGRQSVDIGDSVENSTGRQSVAIGDNVENSAGRQSVDIGDNVENSAIIETVAGSSVPILTTVKESWAGQDTETLLPVENATCPGKETLQNSVPNLAGRPVTMQESSALGRRVMEPQPGCSTDVTNGDGVRQNMHQEDAYDPIILKQVVPGLYGTHDYQMLRSRFLSLFLWPALLSATEVPEISRPETLSPRPLTKSQRPIKKGTFKVTEDGIKYKRRKYACTSGRRARGFRFKTKEQKEAREARNREQGQRVSNLWRAKNASFLAKAEEGFSEYANVKQGDAEVKIGQVEIENGEAEMEIEGAEVGYEGVEEKNGESEVEEEENRN